MNGEVIWQAIHLLFLNKELHEQSNSVEMLRQWRHLNVSCFAIVTLIVKTLIKLFTVKQK